MYPEGELLQIVGAEFFAGQVPVLSIIQLRRCTESVYSTAEIMPHLLTSFHWHTQQEICNIAMIIIKAPNLTTSQTCHYTTL